MESLPVEKFMDIRVISSLHFLIATKRSCRTGFVRNVSSSEKMGKRKPLEKTVLRIKLFLEIAGVKYLIVSKKQHLPYVQERNKDMNRKSYNNTLCGTK